MNRSATPPARDTAARRRPAELPPLRTTPGTTGWPAMPPARATLLLSILYQLEDSQWFPPERLAGLQLRQLSLLLAHCLRAVPYYRKRLRRAGLKPGGSLSPAAWSRVPPLSREEVQAYARGLLAEQVPPGHGELAQVGTSGSTGMPVTVTTTEVSRTFWHAVTLRQNHWHRRDPSGTQAVIRFTGGKAAYPEGERHASWDPPVSLLYETGPVAVLDILTDPGRQLEWLQRQDADYLLTYPTNAGDLARLCLEQGISLPRLREVRLISEPVEAELRALLCRAWDVSVTDSYSTRDVGIIALQCPEHDHYHVQSEALLVEVVDDDGRPCGPGQVGRVLVTTPHNFAMPLIRYDIGDYAEVGEPCPCGRGLPVLKRILGRVRNAVALPGGERHWPSLGASRFRDVAPVRQYQVVQKDLERIEARLVVERPLSAAEEEALRRILLKSLAHPFEVIFSYPERIERSASGKYDEFLCEVPVGRKP